MYEWRKMSGEERKEILEFRKMNRYPWHSPPHPKSDYNTFHITAACYKHKCIIGKTIKRITDFEVQLLENIECLSGKVFAWCILPNHYHFLVEIGDVKTLIRAIGKLHGRTSFQWNGEDGERGRQIWYRCAERAIRSERHFWATTNYIHYNPVHHKYVSKWQDWPYSSAQAYLEEVGREKALEIWNEYPILDYGKGWDDPEL